MLDCQLASSLLLLEVRLRRVIELFLRVVSEAGAEHGEIGR